MTGFSPPLAVDFSLVTEQEMRSDPRVDAGELAGLVEFVLGAEGAMGDWNITVALVDDARLQGLHLEFMGDDTPTDIMTFPLSDGTGPQKGGDLVISTDHAMRAGEWDLAPADEVRFLVIHGLLHLLGWRDQDDQERGVMLARQRDLLADWHRSSSSPDAAGR